jgi:hypothetical protein
VTSPTARPGARRRWTTPLAAWLDRSGVTGWLRALLDVAYATEYGLETGDQSALNLLTMIDANPEPFRVFGDSDDFHVRGGNDTVTAALAARLGSRVETSCALEAVGQGPTLAGAERAARRRLPRREGGVRGAGPALHFAARRAHRRRPAAREAQGHRRAALRDQRCSWSASRTGCGGRCIGRTAA